MQELSREELIELVTRKVLEELRMDTGPRVPEKAIRVPGEKAPVAEKIAVSEKKGLITEKLVIKLKRAGESTVRTSRGDIVTPLAKDAIRRYGMRLEQDQGEENS
jgi:hypothetical protein